ncbi:vacuolar protein sorting-associated protein 62 [Metarhizium album ARSEF 1941]|uniref:Vacuolar protein sorting-associated protein 62 n=1 Tax=Metarhizium album (strain ARSEF 1941) TaxID=1081103 RepID=A0A0B2WUP8_METAS|nr:vacuolar protein sorting-associated protein 62 [Metarhizium album ARSEF 1941]KHN96685.1 vacuolar protein sorting-associated protein 62 [Metarhizium album ARSEF 1941]
MAYRCPLPSPICLQAEANICHSCNFTAPLIWLHSEDPFRPADLLQHIRHTTPTVNQVPVSGLPHLHLNNLALLNNVSSGQVALTSNDDVTALPDWLFGEPPDASGRIVNATPCVVILVEQSPRDVDAFFFYFYSYDRGANITQVLEPLNRLIEDTEHGMHFGDHVGDWEHNMIRFRDGKPNGIYYSQHSGGAAYDWDHEQLSMKDGRPLVFSAYGSHANYASSGDHVHDTVLVDYCNAGQLWDPTLSAYFYHLEPTNFTLTRLFPAPPSLPAPADLTSFFYYTGIWGDAQYPDDHPQQKTVPYFGLKRFVSGPQGPIAKQLVRKGLFPDQRARKPWLQWVVGVFMSWYPCCIRGWRKWVSMTVVVGSAIFLAFGVKHTVKSYRKKGYKRIETDIPLEDLVHRERI